MDDTTRTYLNNLYSADKELQNVAFFALLDITEQPVDWAYEVWDDLVKNLAHKDNHVRAIAAQLLCSLAKSDPQKRMLRDFAALLAVTKDERFVTARHCMQALWQVGIVDKEQQQTYMNGLQTRFQECAAEKNCTLIRYDIAQSLRSVYDVVKDEKIRSLALALIESEDDLKYRKKYAGLWKHQDEA
ncbi:MAG: hypothetical protein U0694_22425 [Anaerolineae bacterium]